ncbi:MAG: MobF family relaxase [Campylobacterota bacterium]
MVSMSGAMGAGSASSYFEKDNYYIKDGETEKGKWYGEGAERLGLKGEVSMDQFKALENGYDPSKLNADQIKTLDQFAKTEASLRGQLEKAIDAKDTSKITELAAKTAELNSLRKEFDKEVGPDAKLVKDGKDEYGFTTHRAGFDITFSAPKSVTIAGLVGGDERVIKAHEEAVKTAMGYIQENFAQTRVRDGEGGRERVNTENLTVAQFNHYTSRSAEGQTPDPQLHTHNFVFNATQTADGKWQSLEPQQIYAAQKFADQIYQNELANKMEKLGYAVEWEKHGQNHTMEIKGISQELKDMYSKRTEQIENHLEKMAEEKGRDLTTAEKQIGKLETRSAKEAQDINKLREDWNIQAAERGYTQESLKEGMRGHESDKRIVESVNGAISEAIKTTTDQKAVFSNHDVTFEALKASRGQFSLAELKEAAQNSKELVSLNAADAKNAKTEKFTSKEMAAAEARIINAVENGKDASIRLLNANEFKEAVQGRESFSGLTQGQKKSVEMIATSSDRFMGIQGDAGTGKTTMLKELKSLVDEKMPGKVELVGLAATGKAASEIEAASGVKSQTIDSFLGKETIKAEEGKQQIWVVDEASMLGTKKMDAIMDRAEKAGARVVFVGDDKQLKAVDAGDMFGKLQEEGKMQFSVMDESLRQKTDTTKEVVQAFKDVAQLEKGMERLQSEGRIVEAKAETNEKGIEVRDMQPVKEQLVTNAVNDYTEKGLNSTIVLTSTNKEKSEFNDAIRSKLQENGKIGKDDRQIKTLEQKSLNQHDAKLAMSYEKGDILVSKGMQGDIKAGMQTRIVDTSKDANQLKVEYTRQDGVTVQKWIDAEKAAKFTAYTEKEKSFSTGEKISFTKNDKDLGVKNGETAIITSIAEDGKITATMEGGKAVTFDSKTYQNIDHAYAMTTYKSQGQSVDNVHVYAHSKEGINNHNAGYVQMSRAKQELTLYTDNAQALTEKYKETQLKENASDYKDVKEYLEERPQEQKPENVSLEGKEEVVKIDFEKLNENRIIEGAKELQQQSKDQIASLREQRDNLYKGLQGFNEKQAAMAASLNSQLSALPKAKREAVISQRLGGQYKAQVYAKVRKEQASIKTQINTEKLRQAEGKLLEKGELNPKEAIVRAIEGKYYSKEFRNSISMIEKRMGQLEKQGLVTKEGDTYKLAVSREDFSRSMTSGKMQADRAKLAEVKFKDGEGFAKEFDRFMDHQTNLSFKQISRDAKGIYYSMLKGTSTAGFYGKNNWEMAALDKLTRQVVAAGMAVAGAAAMFATRAGIRVAYGIAKATVGGTVKAIGAMSEKVGEAIKEQHDKNLHREYKENNFKDPHRSEKHEHKNHHDDKHKSFEERVETLKATKEPEKAGDKSFSEKVDSLRTEKEATRENSEPKMTLVKADKLDKESAQQIDEKGLKNDQEAVKSSTDEKTKDGMETAAKTDDTGKTESKTVESKGKTFDEKVDELRGSKDESKGQETSQNDKELEKTSEISASGEDRHDRDDRSGSEGMEHEREEERSR